VEWRLCRYALRSAIDARRSGTAIQTAKRIAITPDSGVSGAPAREAAWWVGNTRLPIAPFYGLRAAIYNVRRKGFDVATIVILAFPGVQSLDITGPMDVFAEANRFLPPDRHYHLRILGTVPGPIVCSNGMQLLPHGYFEDETTVPDLLMVPGGPQLPRHPPVETLCAWLRDMASRCKRVASICNGAFMLAHAGLLDGRYVTTHWNDVTTLAARFPAISVQPDRIFVRDGNVYTSAGVSAGIDLTLHLVFQDFGGDVSLNVAKRLVVFTQRSGGQTQFSPYLTPYVDEGSVLRTVQNHVLGHIGGDLSVARLADVAMMSQRNFARVFAREANMTPAEFVERARVDAARVLLESSNEPLKTIAHRCGFVTPARMRGAFRRHLNVSAMDYRLHFGAYRDAYPVSTTGC
jgi:transcriptional regulator GlxA family with amidase domain